MASRALGADSVLVTLPNHYAPMPAVMRTLAQFDRARLEGFITVAIGLLDIVDGDPDTEQNGDEDDFIQHNYFGSGPGCPVSDPGCCEHDGCEPDYEI